jgi:hypothetical protein
VVVDVEIHVMDVGVDAPVIHVVPVVPEHVVEDVKEHVILLVQQVVKPDVHPVVMIHAVDVGVVVRARVMLGQILES